MLSSTSIYPFSLTLHKQEVWGLKWDYEVAVPEIARSLFVIPARKVKNRQDKLVALNDITVAITEGKRGKHASWVFLYRGRRLQLIVRSRYRALKRAGLIDIRPHDLRHTFGARLRVAGVRFEDRQDLLGSRAFG